MAGRLGEHARAGLAWTGGVSALRQIVEVATSIVLARLLLPAEFGVIAVVGSVLQVSYVTANLGMGIAVIQSERLSRVDCDVAFTVSLALGSMLAAVVTGASPYLARFFEMADLRLALSLSALQIVLAGAAAVPIALLRRELRFGRLAVVEAGAAAVHAAMSIGMAVHGFGLWSLVWGPVAAGLWTAALATVLSGYRPRPALAREPLGRLGRFGGGLTVKNVFVNAGRTADNLVVARMLGDTAAGLYTRAFMLTTLPQTRVVALIYGVFFPVFCRLRDDPAALRSWLLQATAAAAVVVSPLVVGLWLLAPDFTVRVLGPQWRGLVPSLRILCVAALVNCLFMLGGAVMEAIGRLDYEVRIEGAYALMVVVGSLLGASAGIEGVSWAIVLAACVGYGLKANALRATIELEWGAFVGAALPSVASAVAMAGVVGAALAGAEALRPGLAPAESWGRLLIGTLLGACAYPVILFALGREHFRLVAGQVTHLLGQRHQAARVVGGET